MRIARAKVKTTVNGREWICEVGAYTRDDELPDDAREGIEQELQRLFENWIRGKIQAGEP